MIGLAQTGAGKTGAFALPILQVRSRRCTRRTAAPHASRLRRCQALLDKPQPFFALVLSPTRELALQISGQARCVRWRLRVRCAFRLKLTRPCLHPAQFEALGAAISIRTSTLVGGIDIMAQAISLAKRPHVIVGTPGRVTDHLTNTKARRGPWPARGQRAAGRQRVRLTPRPTAQRRRGSACARCSTSCWTRRTAFSASTSKKTSTRS